MEDYYIKYQSKTLQIMNVSNYEFKISTNTAVSKTLKLLSCVAIFSFTSSLTYAQTAEEIVGTYIENIGGQEGCQKLIL